VSSERSAEEACLEALERLEAENPRINAVIAWDGERALAEARERDGLPHVWRGPLHGVPFTAKDLTDATPYATTYGSLAFAGNVPGSDAACVARLRRAGAVLIGKTNTPEMGARPTTENLLFGATRNPHDETRTPGGSSGGAAAALVAEIGVLAQGSDGGGSIRIPAACCGVVGHKPTRGLVSGAPATYDAWEGLATNGPMARTVAECALMLEVMAGPEPGDAYVAPPHDGAFVAACAEDPAPLRIGVLREPPVGSLDEELGAVFDVVVATLARMGHRLDVPDVPLEALMGPFETIVLGQSAALRRNLPPNGWDRLEPLVREAVLDGERVGVGEYVEVVAAARRGTAAVLEALAPFELIVSPVLTRPAVPLDEFPVDAGRATCWRAYLEWHSYTVPFNVTGQPALSLPCGTTAEGLPVGLQIVGPPGEDALVLSLAAALERALPPVDSGSR
jgi:amidase/aspartyl-tRNA(Asn)/glutamyl-tRNA(Gln) amidotransferase subunit A